MKKLITMCAALALVATARAEEAGWINLFDGTTLAGWTQCNGTATYRVEGGTIVGQTTVGSPNSFLCTQKSYGDFELTFDVKVHNRLNSGVQIRSQTKDNKPEGRVNGPQVEIEASGEKGAEAGYVYGEGTPRGWLTPKDKLIPHKHFKDGEWNSYRIVAQGPAHPDLDQRAAGQRPHRRADLPDPRLRLHRPAGARHRQERRPLRRGLAQPEAARDQVASAVHRLPASLRFTAL
jgi:hypothetical protein